MDPFSFFVICLGVWAILQRTPRLVGQAAAEFREGLHGGTTQDAQDLRQRLLDEGVEPSGNGGPLRQFLGNTWRDYWHGKDRERQEGRDGADLDRERSRWQQRVDDAIDRQSAKYRGTPPVADPTDTTDGTPPSIAQPNGDGPDPAPTGPDNSPEPSGVVHDDDQPPNPGPDDSGPDGPREPETPEPTRPPIRVHATVGEPARSPTGTGTATAVLDPPITQHQIEGNPDMGNAVATNGTVITGVVSGSYEMLSIHRQLEAAVGVFVGQLTAIQNRLNRAGESTVGTVQLSTGSTVMSRMAQAAEAVAALRAASAGCAGEVSPLLLQTKAEFDKRNS